MVLSRLNGRRYGDIHEESPSFIGQGRRLITGEGDFKESATEIDCRIFRRWWKGKVRAYRVCGNADGSVNPVRSKVYKTLCGCPLRLKHRLSISETVCLDR